MTLTSPEVYQPGSAPVQATSSGSRVVITRDSTTAHSPTTRNSPLIVQLQPEPQEAPLIAHLLPPDLPHVENLPLQGMDVSPGALAFEISHSRVAEVFNKLQDDIQLWSADLVDDPVANSPVDGPPELLQQQEQEGQEAGQAVDAQSAVSDQGSAATSTSDNAGEWLSLACVPDLQGNVHAHTCVLIQRLEFSVLCVLYKETFPMLHMLADDAFKHGSPY